MAVDRAYIAAGAAVHGGRVEGAVIVGISPYKVYVPYMLFGIAGGASPLLLAFLDVGHGGILALATVNVLVAFVIVSIKEVTESENGFASFRFALRYVLVFYCIQHISLSLWFTVFSRDIANSTQVSSTNLWSIIDHVEAIFGADLKRMFELAERQDLWSPYRVIRAIFILNDLIVLAIFSFAIVSSGWRFKKLYDPVDEVWQVVEFHALRVPALLSTTAVSIAIVVMSHITFDVSDDFTVGPKYRSMISTVFITHAALSIGIIGWIGVFFMQLLVLFSRTKKMLRICKFR